MKISKSKIKSTSQVNTVSYKIISRQEADPFYESVSLLLKMDGENGSTTFTDSSPTTKTVTRTGNTIISNARINPRIGVTSAYFDGDGDYLSVPNSTDFDFGSGDFTIELWLYIPIGAANDKGIVGKGPWPSGSNNSFLIYFGSGNELTFYYSIGAGWAGSSNFATALRNTWMHLAVSRSGNSIRTFYNGVLSDTPITTSNALATNTNPVLIGSGNAGNKSLNGYIDDIRITKGVARYTSNFTVPNESFPAFGVRTFRMPLAQSTTFSMNDLPGLDFNTTATIQMSSIYTMNELSQVDFNTTATTSVALTMTG